MAIHVCARNRVIFLYILNFYFTNWDIKDENKVVITGKYR